MTGQLDNGRLGEGMGHSGDDPHAGVIELPATKAVHRA